MSPRKREIPGAPPGEPCTIQHEGQSLSAKRGEPLMVTLLAHGIDTASRSIKYHRPRGAFCLAGSCGQCWMRVDDLPNRPACLVPAQEGRSTGRQNAFPSADVDLFRAADFVFGSGFDHHRLATTPISPLNSVMQGTARQMAGLGGLSARAPAPAPPIETQRVPLVIVGSGPAGLAAALTAEAAGWSPRLLETRATIGGQLRSGLFEDVPELAALRPRVQAALGDRVWCHSSALGLYRDLEGPQLLVRRYTSGGDRLVVLRPERILLCTGGYEQSPLFGDNDLPGHYGARALAELVLLHGVLPGSRVAIHDLGTELGPRLRDALQARQIACEYLDGKNVTLQQATGRSRLKGLAVLVDGQPRNLECEVLASARPTAPAYELAQQGGASLRFVAERGFVVVADNTGQTEVPGLSVAGEVAGAETALAAQAQGVAAAQALGTRT